KLDSERHSRVAGLQRPRVAKAARDARDLLARKLATFARPVEPAPDAEFAVFPGEEAMHKVKPRGRPVDVQTWPIRPKRPLGLAQRQEERLDRPAEDFIRHLPAPP